MCHTYIHTQTCAHRCLLCWAEEVTTSIETVSYTVLSLLIHQSTDSFPSLCGENSCPIFLLSPSSGLPKPLAIVLFIDQMATY